MSYTIDGWRNDSVALCGKDDETGELVTLEVPEQIYRNYIDYLKAAAKVAMPNPQLADRAVINVLHRRRMTLGDYGYNND